MAFHYRIYGLLLHSEIPIPELEPIENSQFDIVCRVGDISRPLVNRMENNWFLKISDQSFLVRVDNTALFNIKNGTTIIITPLGQKQATDDRIRLYLTGPILNGLLHQRHRLIFHGSCIGLSQKCFMIAGPSGAGKSTLSAAFLKDNEYYLLSDDAGVISFTDQGIPMIWPSFSRIKLMPGTMKMLNIPVEGTMTIPHEKGKQSVPVPCRADTDRTLLDHIFILQETDTATLHLHRVTGIKKIEALLSNTYWIDDLAMMGGTEFHFAQCSKVARSCHVTLVNYNKTFHPPEKIISQMKRCGAS